MSNTMSIDVQMHQMTNYPLYKNESNLREKFPSRPNRKSMASTPPYHPTHNIKFTAAKIACIVSCVFPDRTARSIEQLESGKSFNNRIYFIKLASLVGQNKEEDVVLKISGQFFGPDKVQNEVSSLLLLERYCPTVPAPRILAWCDTGVRGYDIQVIKRSDHADVGSGMEIAAVAHPGNDEGSCERGWVLISRRPGRVLDPSDLIAEAGERMMKELESSVAQMRKEIPTANRVGNLRLNASMPMSSKLDSYSDLPRDENRMEIKGLLNCAHTRDKPIYSTLEYYQIRLQDKLAKLLTEDVFTSQRARVSCVVEQFLAKDLPKLQLFKQPAPPTFTHYDFSPRNILVSRSPPSVTGLLDFEFAGFFPPEEEFANSAVCNDGDWPADAYEVFLLELERLGIATPAKGFLERSWRETILLMELIENVAPWWLREGGIEGDEVLRECAKAADSVVTCVEKLME